MLRDVPFGTKVGGKRDGVFVAFVTWARIYENYDDPSMTHEYRASLFPMVLMMHRWDGAIGFPGGFVDDARTIEQQALAELREEIGVTSPHLTGMVPLVSHETDRMVLHLFRVNVEASMVHEAISRASKAEHSIAEGNAFWAHLADYGHGKGWGRLRSGNNLSTAVGEELDAVRGWMYANAPDGAYLGP